MEYIALTNAGMLVQLQSVGLPKPLSRDLYEILSIILYKKYNKKKTIIEGWCSMDYTNDISQIGGASKTQGVSSPKRNVTIHKNDTLKIFVAAFILL